MLKSGSILLSMLLAAVAAFAQAPESHQSPVKIDVDLVVVNAAVTDRDGRPVIGLDKHQFHIWEDKVQQDIEYFSTEQIPASVGVVFDISGSMADKLPVAREAVAKFLSSGSPEDEYTLVRFANRPEIAQEFTSDTREMEDHIALIA